MTRVASASWTGVPGSPVDPDGGRGGGGGDWTLLTTANDSMIAHIIEGRLTEEGIECYLDTMNPSPGAFLKPFGDPMAPVKIFVRRFDYEKATLILYDADHAPADPTAPPPRQVRILWIVTMAFVLGSALVFLLRTATAGICLPRLSCF